MSDHPLTRLIAAFEFVHASIRRAWGLTANEYLVLTHLATSPDPLPMGELGKLLNVTSGGLTSLIGRLERDGYVLRQADKFDRRRTRICLAARGEEVRDRVRTTLERGYHSALAMAGHDRNGLDPFLASLATSVISASIGHGGGHLPSGER